MTAAVDRASRHRSPEGLEVLIPSPSPSPPNSSDGLPDEGQGEVGRGRRPAPRGNSRRRPGDGDGGVGGDVRSAGRHTPAGIEALLVLIPPRDLTQTSSTGSPGGSGRGLDEDEDPHHEATRGAGPVTGTAGSEESPRRPGVTHRPDPRCLLVLIPPGDPHTSSPDGSPKGLGPDEDEDPHHEATRGVGPVTGTAGSGDWHDRPGVTTPVESPAQPACRRGWDRTRYEDPHRGATRGVGPVTGTAGSEEPSG